LNQVLYVLSHRAASMAGEDHKGFVDFIVHCGSNIFALKGHDYAALCEVVRSGKALENKRPPTCLVRLADLLQGVMQVLNAAHRWVLGLPLPKLVEPFDLYASAGCGHHIAWGQVRGLGAL
jgi:hypothetical protein